jgi:hypothetical protein
MGVNNKQRRAAKKKAKQRGRAPGGRPSDAFVPLATPEMAQQLLTEVVGAVDADPGSAGRYAELLLRPDGPLPPALAREVLQQMLGDLVAVVVQGGWRPSDLVQVTVRQCGEAHVPAVLALLVDEERRHRHVAPSWRADLASAGEAAALDLTVVAGVQRGLELARLLATLPRIVELLPPPGSQGGQEMAAQGDPKLLARVRALLAKAESTEFPEEAELLSGKAQELVSRHALDELLNRGDDDRVELGTRRIWIDAPYVFAKSMLVHNVAGANRCRSVVSEGLGFCTVVGRPGDLAAVELLVTSLLVQASTAMLRHGRQSDGTGTSRTRSFRQSFLVAYATRIGERLLAADDDAAKSTGRAGELVPVMRRHAEQLDAACEELFPHLVTKEATIRNARGWAAGRAAAELAQLRLDTPLESAAS